MVNLNPQFYNDLDFIRLSVTCKHVIPVYSFTLLGHNLPLFS